jgi:hypothetical protein
MGMTTITEPAPIRYRPPCDVTDQVRLMLGGVHCVRRDVVAVVAALEGRAVEAERRLEWMVRTEDRHRVGLLEELDRKTVELRAVKAELAALRGGAR